MAIIRSGQVAANSFKKSKMYPPNPNEKMTDPSINMPQIRAEESENISKIINTQDSVMNALIQIVCSKAYWS
jgi:hypothetical protein